MGLIKKLINKLGLREAIIYSFYPIKIQKLRGIISRLTLKKCGWGTTIDSYVNIKGGKYVKIGEYVAINSYTHIWGYKGVTIGNRVMIASHVSITSLTHDHNHPCMRFAPAIGQAITIDDDAWIGAHAVIMPGVTINKGAVVGAGAVVREDIPPFAIVVGVPARIIGYRKTVEMSWDSIQTHMCND